MANFKGPPELKKVYDIIVGDISNFYNTGASVCFAGSHGIGKSFTASSVLKYACLKNYNCCFTTLAEMISALIDAPFEDKYNARKQLTMSDLLVIDEMDGRHFGKGLSEDLFGRTLDSIFRTRSSNKLCTIFITNSPNPVEAFSGPIKESISSLMAKVKVIAVRGEDHRKIKQ